MHRFCVFLFLPFILLAQPANLKRPDVRVICERMLGEHAKYKVFDKEMARRSLSCFIDYLDPFKVYLTYEEVKEFIEPTDEMLDGVVKSYRADAYPLFEKIHRVMERATERRSRFDGFLTRLTPLKKSAEPVDLKELGVASDLKELVSRLRVVRTLQLAAGEKLTGALAKDFPRFLEKNRRRFETEIIGKDANERPQALHTAIIKAFASALDSQSAYLTPVESRHFLMGMQKKLVGIGAVLRDDLEGLKITEILKGGPAERSNALRVDDCIIAVDGKPIVGMHIVDSVEMIRGERHIPVTLTLVRGVDSFEVTIQRDEIVFHEARTKLEEHPFADGHVAHIRLQTFYHDRASSTARDIEKALSQSQKSGKLKGVILDMRGNPGGLLAGAIETTGLFIDRGIVASLKSGNGLVQHLRHLGWEPAYRGPLVVLVDATSASSSEIVAGALQDYGRALIVGERTFGKGTFQLCSIGQDGHVSSLGEHKVTSGIYYTVSGRSPQLDGIAPDIQVAWTDPTLKIGERFEKFPLAGGRIDPSFDDDLSDVPIMQRSRIRALYRLSRQERGKGLSTKLSQLKKNSQARLQANTYYKRCLDGKVEEVPIDLQFEEALAITKDLICLESLNA